MSFLGSALSKAKEALTENRELKNEERKRKAKEEARKRLAEAERQRRDELFAEIEQEEEEQEIEKARMESARKTRLSWQPNNITPATPVNSTAASTTVTRERKASTVPSLPQPLFDTSSSNNKSNPVSEVRAPVVLNGASTQTVTSATPRRQSPVVNNRHIETKNIVVLLDSDDEEEIVQG